MYQTKCLILKALEEDNGQELLKVLGELKGDKAVEYMLEVLSLPGHGQTLQSTLKLLIGDDSKLQTGPFQTGPFQGPSYIDKDPAFVELKSQIRTLSEKISKLERSP